MAVVAPNAAELIALKNIINHTSPQNLVLKLYSNNYVPVAGSVAGDFTEVTGGGYAAVTLTGSSWSVATNGSGEAEATYAAQTFTFTGTIGGSGIVYGYFYVQASSGTIIAAERFASSFTPAVSGDSFSFTPKLQLFSEN